MLVIVIVEVFKPVNKTPKLVTWRKQKKDIESTFSTESQISIPWDGDCGEGERGDCGRDRDGGMSLFMLVVGMRACVGVGKTRFGYVCHKGRVG